jgi:dTDP-4-dehydrorhamnose 3,5-epimerase
MDNTMQQTQPEIQERIVQTTPIKGLYVVTMKQITEGRGTIREAYRKSSYGDVGISENTSWAQINVTETRQGGIRGIHAESMNKLVAVIAGEGFGAYVDLRHDSPTKGTVFTVKLTKGVQVFVPKGVGNGFQSVSAEPSQYLYCLECRVLP